MIKEICRDLEFLKLKAQPLAKEEVYHMEDLIDTLKAHLDNCVGMALNMIGVNKSGIAVVLNDKSILAMINPEVMEVKDKYEAIESCLSLSGSRKATRYKKIKVRYYDLNFKIKIKTFNNFEAQVIEHELDHLNGIII